MSPNKDRYLQILNAVGSVASVTGISLLWMKDKIEASAPLILLVFLACAFWLGAAVLGVAYLRVFLQAMEGLTFKIGFALVYIALMATACALVALFINKVMISVNWRWFFS